MWFDGNVLIPMRNHKSSFYATVENGISLLGSKRKYYVGRVTLTDMELRDPAYVIDGDSYRFVFNLFLSFIIERC